MLREVVCGGAPYNSTSWVHVTLAKRARHSGMSDSIPITTILCFSLGADMSFFFARSSNMFCRTVERQLQADGPPCQGQYVCRDGRRGGRGLGRAAMHA